MSNITWRIKPEKFPSSVWGVAAKTKPIRAKPLSCLLVDESMPAKFLLSTLEGAQALKPESVVCVGDGGDAWQQTQKDLLKKYTVGEITPDGWMLCQPKPDNQVDCAEVTSDLILLQAPPESESGEFTMEISALWGLPKGALFVQALTLGDYILRRPEDHKDRWVIRRKMFLATYDIIQSPATVQAPPEAKVERVDP